ncbi:MAG: peptidase domain-containing ABC transporter [Dinghuibacter sp.]|nr:peptidase domain-containing ABC transporter [Dinghuibacter sp.]
MLKFNHLPFQKQLDTMDCAPACLKMIAAWHGIDTSIHTLRELCNTSRQGTSTADIVYAAEQVGFRAGIFKTTTGYLAEKNPLPCMLHWRNNHYVVLYKIKGGKYTIADPGHGIVTLSEKEFAAEWKSDREKGIALFMEPSGEAGAVTTERPLLHKNVFKQFAGYLRPHIKPVLALLLIILVSSLLALLIPKTIEYMTDQGIGKKKVPVIWQMLLFQLALFTGITITNYIKSLIQAKLSTRLSIGIISDFLEKLLKLPVSFFDSKNRADIYQRISDHSRIENFLSARLVVFFFSTALVLVYVVQLFWFDKYIVASFIVFTALSVAWFFLFMKKRKELDYRRFRLAIEERYYLTDLIDGMTEIKLNNAQQERVAQWKELQQKLYGFKLSSLKLAGFQLNGISMLNQFKHLFITFLCSYWVVNGHISFGVMLSIGYIIGQVAMPVQDMMMFFQDLQDARISFERLNEVQSKAEENEGKNAPFPQPLVNGFSVENLWFKYPGQHNNYVLRGISLHIPPGKVTAIVGASGSGKTTLMKLLLAFYEPQEGRILADDLNLHQVNQDSYREHCGVVMQDAYIYNASIARNIALRDTDLDMERVYHALRMACLDEFVQSLPLTHNTLLGSNGLSLSGGQKQRLFIARAVYKNPDIILLDEATNALDANNERAIMNNLENFFIGKTVLVIAHRLSTVKNADQIIVLEKGEIAEAGTHETLAKTRGKYYQLVKNQLELG